MKHPDLLSEIDPMPGAPKFQRVLLALCILLGPLSISLYVIAWTANMRYPLIASAQASPLANTLHFTGAIAASFFLPLGYLGMSLLGMRRSPRLATLCAALSLIGWIPWSGLIALDDLANLINQVGSTPQFTALWTRFNSDTVMTIYLLIYIVGHLLSTVLIGYMLGRLRIIPAWAAWAFALSAPLNMAYFLVQPLEVKNLIKYLISALMIIGAIPAAAAMYKNKEMAQAELSPMRANS